MNHERDQEQGNSLPVLSAKDARYGQQHKAGSNIARMQMLVGKIERGPRDRQGQHRRGKRDASPLHALVFKQPARNQAAPQHDEHNRHKLEEQLGRRQGYARDADECGNRLVKDCGLELDAEELGIVRVERGIEVSFDGAQVNAVVLQAGVVAHHQEGQKRKADNQQGISFIREFERLHAGNVDHFTTGPLP